MTTDMKKITDRMQTEFEAGLSILEEVEVRHDVQGEGSDFIHRIVVEGEEGPWVSKHSIAANGPFRATTEHYRGYFGLPMPRLFFVVAIQHHLVEDAKHTGLRRQPARGLQGPLATEGCSNPAPGAVAGSETDSPPTSPPAVGGESVPRILVSLTQDEAALALRCVQGIYEFATEEGILEDAERAELLSLSMKLERTD
jgi:hypothetical protein